MSWIKIRQALLELSRSHAQINSFGTGNPLAIGTDNTIAFDKLGDDRIQYPLVFADVESGLAQSSKLVLTVGVYFMDRVEDTRQIGSVVSGITGWRDNEDEVLSDMLEVAQDFIAFFTDDPNYEFTLQETTNLVRFVESRDDRTAGWKATMVFDIPFGRDICAIPD